MDNPSGNDVAPVTAGVPALATGNPLIDDMPIGRQIYWNPQLFEMTTNVATMLSGAKGFSPPHLIGNTETCFAVAALSLRTGLDPFFLSQGSYQTPGGQVGYMTRVTNAVVESTGLLKKAPERIYSGPWENVENKFSMKESGNSNGGKKKWYAHRDWKHADAKGCKLKLIFHWKDRDEPEEFEMELSQVSIFNATTWATEPKPQFFRLVYRRAIDVLRPGLLAGVRHVDDLLDEENITMKDITPPKKGNAGLDEFASSSTAPANETVVEEKAKEPETTSAPADDDAPAAEPEGQKEPEPAKPDGITLWVSPDEPARPMKDIPAAIFVLRRLIKEAKTAALAKVVFDRNMPIMAGLDKNSNDAIEAILNRRFEDG